MPSFVKVNNFRKEKSSFATFASVFAHIEGLRKSLIFAMSLSILRTDQDDSPSNDLDIVAVARG